MVDAVREQVGPVDVAAQRVRQLVMGIRGSGGLWTRRLPENPMRRVALFGPALGRVATAQGPVLDRVTGPERPLLRALFSSAARRILRRGPARTELAQAGAIDPAVLLPTANQCPMIPDRSAPGLPAIADFAVSFNLPDLEDLIKSGEAGREILDALREAAEKVQDPNLREQVFQALDQFEAYFHDGQGLPYAFLVHLLELLQDPEGNADELRVLLDRQLPQPPFDDADPGGGLDSEPEVRPCEPVKLDELADGLSDAFDPTGPWVKDRVLDTIDGLEGTECAPVEVCTSVDLPAWRFLRDVAPDWLLPGLGELKPDSVVALESNPRFVAAFLLGLNTQTLAELRWRNLPMITGCTPLRVFWGRSRPDQSEPLDDVLGVHNWNSAGLGDPAHRPPEAAQTDLVLVFKTELFRRYPGTLVSAIQAATGQDGQPDFGEQAEPDGSEPRVWPVFQGAIGEDVNFFGFPLTPQAARGYWLVVEETPAGYRFRSDLPANPQDGGSFASARFNDPTRVLIRGDFLIPET